jgi:hypothetical protein
LGERFKGNNEAHILIADVFALGMVNDAIFDGTEYASLKIPLCFRLGATGATALMLPFDYSLLYNVSPAGDVPFG